MRAMKFFAPLILLVGCSDPTADNGNMAACQAQSTDEGRYGQAFTESGFARLPQNLGPCVGQVIDAYVSDIVRPPRANYTFMDLSTGGVSTVRWVGSEIVSVLNEGSGAQL